MPFQQLVLLGSTERSITLCTRLGTNIKNSIELGPDENRIRVFNALINKHPQWELRVPPAGGYNCVGHVWASRRTGVFEDAEIHRIFEDDGYRVFDPAQVSVHPGDLVSYWHQLETRRNFLHVGLIVEMRSAPGLANKVPFVLSKWDGTSGEVIHHYRDVPFELLNQTRLSFGLKGLGKPHDEPCT